MSRYIFLILLVLSMGCAQSEQLLRTEHDAGTGDAGGRDAGPRDRGLGATDATPDEGAVLLPPETGPADMGVDDVSPLARALTCELSEREVIAASLRFAACVPDEEGLTNVSVLFGLHAIGNMGLSRGWFNMPANCGFWQCAANAGSCADFERCRAPERCPRGEDGRVLPSAVCEGSVAVRCDGPFDFTRSIGDHGVSSHTDCADFGLTCEEGACQAPDCELFLSGELNASCDGDELVLCENGPRVDCRTFNGTSCGSFFQEGEIPAAYCGPEYDGLDENTGECQGNEHVFRQPTDDLGGTREVRIDCSEYGYSQCADRGCQDA